MSYNDKILDKIRNLLELAEDGGNDEESQTALLMAQKLMLKHKVSQQDLHAVTLDQIITKSLSIYKNIYWWEKRLAQTIATNFRIMFYLQSSRFPHQRKTQRKIVFMGYQEDVELAYQVFFLAEEAMKHHAALHLAEMKTVDPHLQTGEERRAYYQGFLDGLAKRFESQRAAMSAENADYALVIQVPSEVQTAFQQQVNGKIVFKQPASAYEAAAYQAGYDRGQQLELTVKRLNQ